jgi:mRNA interferase RelE/StbE
MYKIVLSGKAKKQLSKLPKEIQNRIGSVIERLKIRPWHLVKKIMGSPYFRARAGDYRLILDIKKKILIIYIVEVGQRKNIYKEFQ